MDKRVLRNPPSVAKPGEAFTGSFLPIKTMPSPCGPQTVFAVATKDICDICTGLGEESEQSTWLQLEIKENSKKERLWEIAKFATTWRRLSETFSRRLFWPRTARTAFNSFRMPPTRHCWPNNLKRAMFVVFVNNKDIILKIVREFSN